MRLLALLASSAVLSATFLAVTAGEARADDTKAAAPKTSTTTLTNAETQPAAPAAADADKATKTKGDEEDLKNVSLTVNPLGLAIGRYSVSGEYLVARHHAISLNPFYAHAPVTVTVNGKEIDGGSLNGFGGELGYRYYTSSKGPAGFFVGPSLLLGHYSQSAPSGNQPSGSNGSDSFSSYGAAIDIGGQGVVGPGIVIGGGFGLQYTKTSQDIDTGNLNLASAIIAGGGIRPRFLLSLGYAF
ncbi:MAG: hypothetical protein JWP97_269 [Labilithrix sp.]|nr:hypothetical protein [Labilithrix sp.]